MAVASGRPGQLIRALWPTTSDWSEGGRELFIYRVRAQLVDFVALGQVVTGAEGWRVNAAERVYNGAHDEIHVSVSRRDDTRQHVFPGI